MHFTRIGRKQEENRLSISLCSTAGIILHSVVKVIRCVQLQVVSVSSGHPPSGMRHKPDDVRQPVTDPSDSLKKVIAYLIWNRVHTGPLGNSATDFTG